MTNKRCRWLGHVLRRSFADNGDVETSRTAWRGLHCALSDSNSIVEKTHSSKAHIIAKHLRTHGGMRDSPRKILEVIVVVCSTVSAVMCFYCRAKTYVIDAV